MLERRQASASHVWVIQVVVVSSVELCVVLCVGEFYVRVIVCTYFVSLGLQVRACVHCGWYVAVVCYV